MQDGVFECDIATTHFEELKERLGKVLTDEDGPHYYVLCAECLQKVEVDGGRPATETQLYYLV